MRLIITILITAAIVSCNSSEDSIDVSTDKDTINKNEPKPVSKPADAGVSGCYMKILQRDTFAIQLQQTKNDVTGKLTFDNFEKDGSTGTVHGMIEGNIVKLWYNFASEGMNSVMEVYFKKDGDNLLRGNGSMDAKGDSSYYTDHSAIQYLQDQSFSKLSCEQLPEKYK